MARILLVEDNLQTLEIYGVLLTRAGYVVGLAPTLREGLDQARAQPFDLALVDLLLPDGTAIDLLGALKRDRITLPVIVVTGAGSLETAVEAMREGAIDYAVKPLIGDDLLAKIEWGLRHAAGKNPPTIPPEAYAHAATRWAALVVAILSAPTDIRTNREWARHVGVSTTTLRDWCRLAHTSAARSLALGRLLRAVHLSQGRPWRPEQRLNVSDPRTLARLIERSGLAPGASSVTLLDLLMAQSFVDDGDALLAMREALKRFTGDRGSAR